MRWARAREGRPSRAAFNASEYGEVTLSGVGEWPWTDFEASVGYRQDRHPCVAFRDIAGACCAVWRWRFYVGLHFLPVLMLMALTEAPPFQQGNEAIGALALDRCIAWIRKRSRPLTT